MKMVGGGGGEESLLVQGRSPDEGQEEDPQGQDAHDRAPRVRDSICFSFVWYFLINKLMLTWDLHGVV